MWIKAVVKSVPFDLWLKLVVHNFWFVFLRTNVPLLGKVSILVLHFGLLLLTSDIIPLVFFVNDRADEGGG